MSRFSFEPRHPTVTFWIGWLIAHAPHQNSRLHRKRTQIQVPADSLDSGRSAARQWPLQRPTSSPGALRPSFTQRSLPPFLWRTKTALPSQNVLSYSRGRGRFILRELLFIYFFTKRMASLLKTLGGFLSLFLNCVFRSIGSNFLLFHSLFGGFWTWGSEEIVSTFNV